MDFDLTLKALRNELDFMDKLINMHLPSDIMLQADGSVWVDSCGKLIKTKVLISREKAFLIFKYLGGYHNIIVDVNNPNLSAMIPTSVLGGGRFDGFIPPITSSPTFTIRIPATNQPNLKELVNKGTMRDAEKHFILDALKNKKNIVIAGGTGSGKTTILNALVEELKLMGERLFIIEDQPEINSDTMNGSANIISVTTSAIVTIKDLVKASLRARPDRILVGELRDGLVANELLNAWQTGHPGGIATIHANNAAGVGMRLHELLKQIHAVPSVDLINTVDVVIFVERSSENTRIVTEIKAPLGFKHNRL